MTSAVTKRRLGNTDIEITPIGVGTMQLSGGGLVGLAYPAVDEDVSTGVIRAAVAGGINWFDTAEMYGHGRSESALANGLRAAGVKPGEVVVATKWAPFGRTAGNIGRTIHRRRSALAEYPIDLHQIHMPFGSLSSIPAQVRAMAELVQAGKIRSVGVSNFSATQMEKAAATLAPYGIRLAANQVQISALHRKIDTNGVLATARRLGVTLIAYSPLASGILTGRFHDDPAAYAALPRGRRLALGRNPIDRTAPVIDELRRVAASHDVAIPQVALAWLTTFYGETVVAIPGASKPRQAEQSAAAMDIRLSATELARIDEASRRSSR